MNRSPSTRSSLKASLLFFLALLSCAVPLLLAQAPAWWDDILVKVGGVPVAPADYAIINQGQLKNFAGAAFVEMNDKFPALGPSPAMAAIEARITGWIQKEAAGTAHDYAPVNLGQLKAVVRLFYNRLKELDSTIPYPWSATGSDDYSLANIGQAKSLFSFGIAQFDDPEDSDHDGLKDVDELTLRRMAPSRRPMTTGREALSACRRRMTTGGRQMPVDRRPMPADERLAAVPEGTTETPSLSCTLAAAFC